MLFAFDPPGILSRCAVNSNPKIVFRLLNSVNRKALFIVSFIFLLSFVLIITSFWFKGSMKEVYVLIDHANTVENILQRILYRTKDGEADMRAYVITHQKSFYNSFANNKKHTRRLIRDLQQLVKDSEQIARSTELGEYIEARFRSLEKMALLIDSLDISEFQRLIEEGEGISQRIENHLGTMVAYEKEILSKHEHNLFSLMDLRQKLSISGSLLAIVLSVITFKFIKDESASIQRRQELLQELNNNKNIFFSIVSHDLRNPFSAIKILVEMLNDSDYVENKETIYKMLQSSSDRFDSLLDNLLTWARLQMDAIKVHKEKIQVNELLYQVSGYYIPVVESKKLSLEVKADEMIFAFADKAMTETILRNLISNAVKFTSKGKIILSAYNKKNKIVIEVKDTGSGMEKYILENLFQIGKINSTKGTQNETGTGMGLILCKDMAERQGGSLQVHSVAGKGTTIRLYLNEN